MCAGQQAVVHCAALCVPWPTRRLHSAAHDRSNLQTTIAVLRGCARAGGVRLVHVSTPSLYYAAGDADGMAGRAAKGGVPEWAAAPPLGRQPNQYAATKLAAEAAVQRAMLDGLQATVLRPRAIFGEGDPTILPRLLTKLRARRVASRPATRTPPTRTLDRQTGGASATHTPGPHVVTAAPRAACPSRPHARRQRRARV